MAKRTMSLKGRLFSRTVIDGDCIMWTGAYMGKHRYGAIKIGKGMQYTHRVSYELEHGAIPNGMVVMHSCDKPMCINPDHLSVGTQHENILDMHSKNRAVSACGSSHSNAKLTEDDVRAIRLRFVRYCHQNGAGAISRDYSVSKTVILDAIKQKTWKQCQ